MYYNFEGININILQGFYNFTEINSMHDFSMAFPWPTSKVLTETYQKEDWLWDKWNIYNILSNVSTHIIKKKAKAMAPQAIFLV